MIELLVVIGVIALLAALLLPVFASAKDRAKRAKCLSNLHQYGIACFTYAAEFNDRLPVNQWGPRQYVSNWGHPWLFTITDGDNFMRIGGLTRDAMYCPANPDMNVSNLWYAGSNGLFHEPAIAHVTGYSMTFPGTQFLAFNEFNTNLFPQTLPDGTLAQPSRRVLVSDLVLSWWTQTDPTQAGTYQWTGFTQMGTPTAYFGLIPPPLLRTSHLDSSGRFPSGANNLMLDGSVKWNRFSTGNLQMSVRTYEGPFDIQTMWGDPWTSWW